MKLSAAIECVTFQRSASEYVTVPVQTLHIWRNHAEALELTSKIEQLPEPARYDVCEPWLKKVYTAHDDYAHGWDKVFGKR